MTDIQEQIKAFTESCNELKKCKFIMATTKIKDILKCIVNSPDIYNLFNRVTKNYDYLQEKSKRLVIGQDGNFPHGYLVMPETLEEILAFSFCLLAEFDNETLDFNNFVRTYFPEDGSYFSSFHAFCNAVICPMRDAVAECFKTDEPAAPAANPQRAQLLSALDLSISEEKQFISTNGDIPEDDKEGGISILTCLYSALKAGNTEFINALVCGYNYYVLYYRAVSEGIAGLIELIAKYEEVL